MAVVRILASLDRDTLMPEDVVQNTFHVTTQDNTEPGRSIQAGAAITALSNLYLGIDHLLASTLAGTMTFRAYDLAEPEPRAPFTTVPLVIAPAATALPSEVAVTLSFQGIPVSGQVQARRRGRVFIGPLATVWLQPVTGGVRPETTSRQTLADQAELLHDADLADATWSWIVWSPTNAGPENPDGTFPNPPAGITNVNEGWVDNAFDTMRSRGLAGTSRIEWT